jgi:hypothetical protein
MSDSRKHQVGHRRFAGTQAVCDLAVARGDRHLRHCRHVHRTSREIVGARRGSPLIIGIGDGEIS